MVTNNRYIAEIFNELNNAVGFNRLAHQLDRCSASNDNNYPPHNVVCPDDKTTIFEFAVAGFEPSEIDIKMSDGTISIIGFKKDENKVATGMYKWKGISTKKIQRTIAINKNVEVKDTFLKNGILSIVLEQKEPEDERVKTLSIRQE